MSEDNSNSFPNQWKDYSLDYKCMFIYHGFMMILFILGDKISINIQFTIVALLLISIILFSIKYRIRIRWKWPGVEVKNTIYAIMIIILGLFFFFSSINSFPPFKSQTFPWYSAGFGIILFQVLNVLNITAYYKDKFELKTDKTANFIKFENSPLKENQNDNVNVSFIKYLIYFFSFFLWVTGISYFWLRDRISHNDNSEGIAKFIIEITNKFSKFLGITNTSPDVFLKSILSYGIILLSISIFIIHFIFGIKIISNVPTIKEYLRKK
ncbi:hypothetical protein CH372_17350 [Leptospira meyeri]|uniref:hypothetical protein n=1 Tax=Leptospira meyeri TaxID=29508 RepID=UPI000C2AD364|nr:hypothetical protein [Leptospira meyeri]PKA10849.1 hypothetical protein CH372_17350 [Leptospira meyeri]